jgi:hypothetical protein
MTRSARTRERLPSIDEAALDQVVGGHCDLSMLSGAARQIIGAESGGDPYAKNKTSTASGLGQLVVENRLNILGDDYDSPDCGLQIGAYHGYVAKRYRGSDKRALAFRKKNGWY